VLSDFRECATSDPLDRIYALIGLCKEEERAGNRPDYEISIADALIRLTIGHINVNKDLDILCIATRSGRVKRTTKSYAEGRIEILPVPAHLPEAIFIPDLPTWVPSLTSVYSRWRLGAVTS
jgi:hypothetical protein